MQGQGLGQARGYPGRPGSSRVRGTDARAGSTVARVAEIPATTDYIRSDPSNHSPAGVMRSHARLGTALWLLAAPAGVAAAQGPRSTVGAELGYSRSDLRGADATGIEARQGALTGVYLEAPLV